MLPDSVLVLINIPRVDWCGVVSGARQLVGRSQAAHIRIPARYASVSRRHAEIWSDNQGYWLCDVGSLAGTRVNGIWLRCNEPATLELGDRITLGTVELRLEEAVGRSHRGNGLTTAGRHSESDTLCPAANSPVGAQLLIERLSFSEHNLVMWMGRGYIRDDELSKILHRSPHTIRTQVGNILKKLELRSRACVLNDMRKPNATLRVGPTSRDSRAS